MIVTNSTSDPSERRRSCIRRKPLMFLDLIPTKISSFKSASYLSAFPGVVQPCQMREIIFATPRVDVQRVRCSLASGASAWGSSGSAKRYRGSDPMRSPHEPIVHSVDLFSRDHLEPESLV